MKLHLALQIPVGKIGVADAVFIRKGSNGIDLRGEMAFAFGYPQLKQMTFAMWVYRNTRTRVMSRLDARRSPRSSCFENES